MNKLVQRYYVFTQRERTVFEDWQLQRKYYPLAFLNMSGCYMRQLILQRPEMRLDGYTRLPLVAMSVLNTSSHFVCTKVEGWSGVSHKRYFPAFFCFTFDTHIYFFSLFSHCITCRFSKSLVILYMCVEVVCFFCFLFQIWNFLP